MIRKIIVAGLAVGAVSSTAVRAEWLEGSSKHFLVYADASPAKVKEMTTALERFDKALRTALKLREPEVGPDARVKVFVLPEISDVQKMMGGKSGNVAGYYRGDAAPGPTAFVPAKADSDSTQALTPLKTLQHEYTHHVMYSSWGDVVFPTWFSEGFAELFATARNNSDGGVVIGAVPLYRSYGIDQMNAMPVEKLVSGPPDYKDGLQAQIFYGRAWLLTHYLIFDPERAKQLAAYIGAINEGKSAEEANKLLGITGSLDLKLNNYGRRQSLPSAVLTAAQLPIDDVVTRPLTAGEAATMMARMRSQNGVDKKLAQEVVVQAREAAAPYPNDAGAQNELAEAEYDAGNYAASEAAADRAMAADPKSVHAIIYKGMAQVALAEKAGVTDPAVWSTARRWFLQANKVDPLYSYPIQLYYESFATAKQVPTRGAKDGLIYAYKLAPQVLELRFETAKVFLQDGNLKAARIAIEPIAYNERGGKIAEIAKKAMAAIDKNDSTGALALLVLPSPDEKPDDGKGKKS